MVSKGLMKGGSITVDMKKVGPNQEFVFNVKKGKNGSFVSESLVSQDKTSFLNLKGVLE